MKKLRHQRDLLKDALRDLNKELETLHFSRQELEKKKGMAR